MHQTFPKPEPRKRVKAREDRHEAAVKQAVREQCVERDGRCFLGKLTDPPFEMCKGPSEWAHIGGDRRFKTVGKPAEERHTTAGTCMLCQQCHRAYDAHRFDLVPVDAVLGMNGAVRVVAR